MIDVLDLRKSYGDLVAVDSIGFSIARGETFGLLGPNGAGKSTAIHCMSGLLAPDAGEIRIAGEPDPSRPEVRRALGVSPQRLSLYEELSGAENLRFFGRLYGLTGEQLRARVDWCLEFAGLTERRSDAVKAYSGGMQRRLNLACALVHEPRVLFLDEPTVGVDPQSRNHIFDNIEALKAEGLTVLYTTHYMEEAERLCDRIAIVDRGRILALDTLDALIDAHGGDAVVHAELRESPADASRLPHAPDGTRLEFLSSAPEQAVAQIAAAGVALKSLHVERPNLEAVFLKLTGRSLRD